MADYNSEEVRFAIRMSERMAEMEVKLLNLTLQIDRVDKHVREVMLVCSGEDKAQKEMEKELEKRIEELKKNQSRYLDRVIGASWMAGITWSVFHDKIAGFFK